MRYLLILALAGSTADAGWRRRHVDTVSTCQTCNSAVSQSTTLPAGDPLAEVNAQRAKRGLRPYLPDPGLSAAAAACAQFRASNRIQGHTANDFQFAGPGTSCRATGCAAWPPHLGFGACLTDATGYSFAGAASVRGADGLVYHSLFVR